jgi:hypothetical protein
MNKWTGGDRGLGVASAVQAALLPLRPARTRFPGDWFY